MIEISLRAGKITPAPVSPTAYIWVSFYLKENGSAQRMITLNNQFAAISSIAADFSFLDWLPKPFIA
jgi:hypothetical protein